MKTVMMYAVAAAVIALVTGPIPGSSLILTGLEILMTYQIAKRYRVHLALGDVGLMAGAVYGVSAFLKLAVSTLMELVPFVGWFIGKPAVAFVFVLILGTVANSYFKDHLVLNQV